MEDAYHANTPSLKITHFVGPYTFTDPNLSASRRQYLVNRLNNLKTTYGDEIGLDGGPDPASRKSFPWDRNGWNRELLTYVKTLTALRKSQPALRGGTFHRLYADHNIYAFARKLGTQRVVVVMNASYSTHNVNIPVSGIGIPNGPISLLFGEGKARVSEGQIHGLKLAPRSGIVFKA